MFRPDETGGLGLTDTTAEHVMQAVGLALPRREPYFRRQANIAEAESLVLRESVTYSRQWSTFRKERTGNALSGYK